MKPATSQTLDDAPSLLAVQSKETHWDFSRKNDVDFNGWPDNWLRYTGLGFPKYIKIQIVPHEQAIDEAAVSIDTSMIMAWPKLRETFPRLSPLPPSLADLLVDRFFAIDMDGGQARLQSPAYPTSQLYQYHFTCRMMTQGLRHDVARISLVFLDSAGKEISVLDAPELRGTTPWTKLEIDRVRPPTQATQMSIRISVLGSEDGLQDIRGRVGIDDIRIEPFPQLELSSDRRLGVYEFGKPITITAKVLGTPAHDTPISFRLVDHNGNSIAQHKAQSELITPKIGKDAKRSQPDQESKEHAPIVKWTLPAVSPGFYRVLCSFADDTSTRLATETTLAVIEPIAGDELGGPFGWSLPQGDRGVEPRELADWLHKLGVAVVKYPCWVAPDDLEKLEQNAAVLGRIQSQGIRTIGVLDKPPASELSNYEIPIARDVIAANLFRDRAIWHPRLEPIMSHMSLKVRTWQLGADRDHSFMGRPRLKETIGVIADGLQGFGQPLDFAVSWPWLEPTPSPDETGLHAYVRSNQDLPFTANELDATLESNTSQTTGRKPATWLLLDPIRSDRYSRNARIQDLVMQMAAIQKHDVEVATITDPYDPYTGLLTEDGRPDELLLPWRTASLLLGNVRHVGSLMLRNGAENQVFAGPKQAVVMIWSPSPSTEELYLGEDVKQIDVWGRVTDVPTKFVNGHKLQTVSTGPMPIFLVNVDAALLAFRMSVAIAENQIDSVLGRAQKLSVVFTNPSRDLLAGTINFRHPKAWTVDSSSRPWTLQGTSSAQERFDVVLGNVALIGEYEIALDFDFETTPPKHVTVYRKVNVGVEGLSVKLTTELTQSDEIRVAMEMTNASNKSMAYDCTIFPPPGRQYKRRFVTIGPQETVSRDFFFSGGRELLGEKMLLRAVEDDGQRVINFDTLIVR